MTTHTHGEVGPIGEEAAKLLEALQVWARQSLADAPIATGAPECEWCPVCQLVAIIRGDRPETAEKIVSAGTALLAAVRGLLEPAPAPPAEPAEPARVERIDLGE